MKTKILIYFSLLLTGLISYNCGDEFLDTKPLATSDESSFYTTMTSADMAVTACYSAFCIEKTWDLSVLMTLGSIASDEAEAGAGGKGDVIEFQEVDQLRHTATTARVFNWCWGYLYRAIGYCNVALEKLPEINEASDPSYDADLINTRMAEARFVRAITYFYLTQIFGGVPKVDHVLTPSEYAQPRVEIYEIYDLIKSDLRQAIPYLPEKSEWGVENAGRASKGAAKALLAKVYLFESSYAKYYAGEDDRFNGLNQHWDSVVYYAEDVINSGEYGLVGAGGERFDTWKGSVGGYTYIFMADGNNSDESVFSIQARQDGLGWFASRGTALVRWCAPRQIQTASGPADHGWGWWCPTDFLMDSYETGDPRYKATCIQEEDSVLTNIASDGGLAWRHPSYTTLENGTGLSSGTRKYECSPDEYWDQTSEWKEGPINVKIIRFAEVILMAAEAHFELSHNEEARDYINMVRSRARASGESGAPADLSGTITHEDIEYERLWELGLEGHRYYDLVRWDLGVQYLDQHRLADQDIITYVKGKHEFFPIPDAEIGYSGGVLEQYPAWE